VVAAVSLEENETRVCQRIDATLGLGSLSQNLERRVTRKKSGREKRGEKKRKKKKTRRCNGGWKVQA
jgi:hypothetical protein